MASWTWPAEGVSWAAWNHVRAMGTSQSSRKARHAELVRRTRARRAASEIVTGRSRGIDADHLDSVAHDLHVYLRVLYRRDVVLPGR